jgi:acetyl esterase/lipase
MSAAEVWSRIARAADSALTRLAFTVINLPARFATRRRGESPYGEEARQVLDIYAPRSPSTTPRPLVVFWHGGHWQFGDKRDYRFVAAALSALGCIAVLPNYRHYPRVKMAGFMQDAALAFAWAAENARNLGADPQQLFVMGHSAGAHIAALLALDARHLGRCAVRARIAGVIGLSGPYDFLPLTAADLKDIFGPPEQYLESQPIHFARVGAPPMLLIHGWKDTTVKPKNSVNLAAALSALGVPVTLRMHEHTVHSSTVAALSPLLAGRLRVREDIAGFLAASMQAQVVPARAPRAAGER